MKKHKFLLSILSLSLFIPSTTYADCTKEEIDNFKEIEDEYKVTYEFDTNSKKYAVYLNNIDSEHYTFSGDLFNDNFDTSLLENNEIKIEKVDSGNYSIKILSTNESCETVLKTITLELPKYNKYYGDPLCENIEEFVLCQQTYDKDIDYDTFVSRTEVYKKSKQKKEITDKKEKLNNNQNNSNRIIEYVKENIIQIIIVIVFIIMVVITIILTAKSIEKSRRLE